MNVNTIVGLIIGLVILVALVGVVSDVVDSGTQQYNGTHTTTVGMNGSTQTLAILFPLFLVIGGIAYIVQKTRSKS